MTGKLDEISFKLGEIIAEITGLKEDVKGIQFEVKDDREASDKYRSEMREEVKSINEILTPLAAEVKGMAPHVNDYKTLKEKIGVAVFLVSTIGAGAVYLIWQGLVNFGPVIKEHFMKMFK